MINQTQTLSETIQAHNPDNPHIWVQAKLVDGEAVEVEIRIYDSRWSSIDIMYGNEPAIRQLKVLHSHLGEMVAELERREALRKAAEPCPEATTNDQPSTK